MKVSLRLIQHIPVGLIIYVTSAIIIAVLTMVQNLSQSVVELAKIGHIKLRMTIIMQVWETIITAEILTAQKLFGVLPQIQIRYGNIASQIIILNVLIIHRQL